MPQFSTNTERGMFQISIKSLGIDLDEFYRRLTNQIDEMRAQGYSLSEIVNTIETDQSNGIGTFSALKGAIEKDVDIALNRQFQLSSNEPLAQAEKLVKRVLNPSAEHCDTCVYLAGLPPMPISEIEYPSMQATHGETNCSVYCRCTIEIAEEVPA